MQWKVFVGCDMSKADFDFCISTHKEVLEYGKIKNDGRSIRSWLSKLKKQYKAEEVLLGVEHTGVYTSILLREAYNKEISIALESARQIKLSLGMQRGKNDKVDAHRVSEYLMRYTDRLRLWKPKRQVMDQLSRLQSCRKQLIKAHKQLSHSVKENKRFLQKDLAQITERCTKSSLTAIEKDMEWTNKRIEKLITSDENLSHLQKLVTSIPGVGKVTYLEFVIRTNEFTAFASAKKLACTAGVAPFEYRSGSSVRGKTKVNHQAHKSLKTLLHMCALAAIRVPGELQDYYNRKVKDGGNKMSVINAVRNKLVHRIFAVVRDNVMYEKNYRYKFA